VERGENKLEDFLTLVIMLAVAGTAIGIVLGIVASFIRIGTMLAPIVVGGALMILFYQVNDYNINFEERANEIIELLQEQEIPNFLKTE
jgi:hypothetical protein